MKKYTMLAVSFALLTLVSILGAMFSSGTIQAVSTIGIGIFWIAGLVSVFVRGFVWYRQDLANRAADKVENDQDENDESPKSEAERLFS